MIGDDTYDTRRHLPHLEKPGKTFFMTFTAIDRRVLPSRRSRHCFRLLRLSTPQRVFPGNGSRDARPRPHALHALRHVQGLGDHEIRKGRLFTTREPAA